MPKVEVAAVGHLLRRLGPLPTSAEGHTEDTTHEFVLELLDRPWGRLRLPRPFALEMEGRDPHGMWVRFDGCCNGPVLVDVEDSANGIMYFTRGWKSFIRARCLGQGHLVHFSLEGSDTHVVKFFGVSGARLECCAKSSSDGDTASSSETEDDDNDGDDDSPYIKIEDDSSTPAVHR